MNEAASKDAAVVTPWYPTRELPFRGAFVRAMVDATAPGCDTFTVYHCDAWVAAMDAAAEERVEAANRKLLARAVHAVPTSGGAELVHFPVTTPRGQGYGAQARNHARQLSAALGGRPIPASVVHAHVGLPGGWAALECAAPGARVFVTEHASFLDKILAEPEARAMYDELLRRVDGFFAVGDPIRERLAEAFPHHVDKVRQIPNPIAFGVPREAPVQDLRKWLFVGGLSKLKGVDWLLEAFAQCHADDPALTLSYVGDGESRTALTARVAELGLGDAVEFHGSVGPDRALELMREHDVLVHPSRYETFGMVVVEAVAAGMPVLVTRCGGPEQSLAGVEDAAAQFIDVEENAESVAEGYRALRSRFEAGGLDLEQAQKVLAGRYGYEAVAEAHYRLWFAPSDRPDADAARAVARD
ncbi:glycosyltransferase family 4 protein [Streptomyces sp. NPDC021224]|uniref:glycosyltransferase family 4 protein n=1 Tax=unclassified Streptomyces TaxID=2593676 RepID=UPI0037B0364F